MAKTGSGNLADLPEEELARLQRRLVRCLMKRRFRKEDAEELAQDALLKGLAEERHPKSWEAWLHSVAARDAATLCRKRDTARGHLERLAQKRGHPIADRCVEAEERELLAHLQEEIDRLPLELRWTVLRHCDGSTYAQIARQMGCSTQTVKRRLGKARDALWRALRPLL
ncbi:MAG TPA: sigma-70 family RNA polymerase sigma factor [Gemmataceae bacterium]|nr:sigma-70 family RNA polymerase sigma factor [Gemmataceae bacterium]